MIQPKRTYGDKIMEALEKIGLSEQEREKIFSYVSGERGEEALQGLTARDFYQLAETQLEAAAALFSHFCDRHPEEAKKCSGCFLHWDSQPAARWNGGIMHGVTAL